MKSLLLCHSLALVLAGTSLALAQGPPVPPPPAPAPPTTLFNFFGIPQGFQKVRDAQVNKRGNNPQRERKPPLKRIGDPALLSSNNPAIKKAAEVKTEEDMAPQKIKAIKYLASIGCGCYNRDGGITAALLAAMDDCTEEVRLAAVNAIMDAACADACVYCKQKTCCTPAIAKRLEKMAFEQDDKGCWFEPSARVRAAAAQAAKSCSQKLERQPGSGQPEIPRGDTPTPEVPAIDGAGRPRPSQPAASRLVPARQTQVDQPAAGRTAQIERIPAADAEELAQGLAENELRSAVAMSTLPVVDYSAARQIVTPQRRMPAPQAVSSRAIRNETPQSAPVAVQTVTPTQEPVVAASRPLFDNPPAPERRSVLVNRPVTAETEVAARNNQVAPAQNQPVPTRVVTAKRIVTKRKTQVETSTPDPQSIAEEKTESVEQPATPEAGAQQLLRFRPAGSTAATAPLRVTTAKPATGNAEAQPGSNTAIRYLDGPVRLTEAPVGERRY